MKTIIKLLTAGTIALPFSSCQSLTQSQPPTQTIPPVHMQQSVSNIVTC